VDTRSSRLQPERSDVLLQVRVMLPLAGTWRVTAGFENAMLKHIGDVVAADYVEQVSKDVESPYLPKDVKTVASGNFNATFQQQRLQLPEAIESDDDEPLTPSSAPPPDTAAGMCVGVEDVEGAEVEHVLCVKGAGLADGDAETKTNEAKTVFSYTHAGCWGVLNVCVWLLNVCVCHV
jgi:hypothetical protein